MAPLSQNITDIKMNKIKVGVIGNGFVGEAQAFAFSSVADVYVYDKNPQRSKDSIDEVNRCEFVFICVPTPMKKSGEQDLSYVFDVFKNASSKPIYILKSTVLPGTTDLLSREFSDLKIIFSPEFLTERTSKLDMLTQSRIILGGSNELIEKVESFYLKRFKNKNIIKTESRTAELIKYMNNTFFAVKISVMNEFKLICDSIGADWDDAIYGFVSDSRIADSHINVPGHDGKLGFGGTCFPKDINALINFAKKHKINLNTLSGAWKTNLQIRPEKDWEKKIGRSVSP